MTYIEAPVANGLPETRTQMFGKGEVFDLEEKRASRRDPAPLNSRPC